MSDEIEEPGHSSVSLQANPGRGLSKPCKIVVYLFNFCVHVEARRCNRTKFILIAVNLQVCCVTPGVAEVPALVSASGPCAKFAGTGAHQEEDVAS